MLSSMKKSLGCFVFTLGALSLSEPKLKNASLIKSVSEGRSSGC